MKNYFFALCVGSGGGLVEIVHNMEKMATIERPLELRMKYFYEFDRTVCIINSLLLLFIVLDATVSVFMALLSLTDANANGWQTIFLIYILFIGAAEISLFVVLFEEGLSEDAFMVEDKYARGFRIQIHETSYIYVVFRVLMNAAFIVFVIAGFPGLTNDPPYIYEIIYFSLCTLLHVYLFINNLVNIRNRKLFNLPKQS
jgi:hypothetical protein